MLIDLITDFLEKREREAKRELKLAGQSAANQRGSAELSVRALAGVALPATQARASRDTDELNEAALLDTERTRVGSNGTQLDGRGLVDEGGRSVASEAASTAASTPTSASTVDLTYKSGSACCTGASASRARKEQASCNTTGPSSECDAKVIIRWLPAETSPAARPSGPLINGKSQSMKQAGLPVKQCASHPQAQINNSNQQYNRRHCHWPEASAQPGPT